MTRSMDVHFLCVLASVSAVALGARGLDAQPPIGGTNADRSRFEPVEQNVGDVGPLSRSARLMPTDLRVPLGFDRVYRMPGSERGIASFGRAEEKFVRFSGGLAAVFPRSEYVETPIGALATIPAGTTFYIGGMNNAALNPGRGFAERADVSPLAVSNAVGNQVGLLAMAQPANTQNAERADLRVRPTTAEPRTRARERGQMDRSSPSPHVFTDAEYRNKRVRSLLEAAARGSM